MSNTLIYGLSTLGTGVIGLAIRYCFKSKCQNVSVCFGLITINRDIKSEVEIEGIQLQHNPPTSPNESQQMVRQDSNNSL